MSIPESKVVSILGKIKASLARSLSPAIADNARIKVIYPENWEISLFVAPGTTKIRPFRKAVEKALFDECGVERNCCDYLGKDDEENAYEWYFRHPNVPSAIYERLESEIEQELGGEIGMGLPSPSGFASRSATAFITVKEEYYDQIASGRKTTEYRNLNQYYCDKFFSPGVKKQFVKINRGYKTGTANQMTFEIADIRLVNEDGSVEIPALDSKGKLITSFSQLPPRFAPAAYGIVLGRRIA